MKAKLYKAYARYAAIATGLEHFGGMFAALYLIGELPYDVAVSTAALVAATAAFEHNHAQRLDRLEAKVEARNQKEE